MRLERIRTDADARFDAAFALYEQSFPVHERRTRAMQAAVMGRDDYHFDLLMQGDALAGILLYWVFSGLAYVEHFAVDEAMRGRRVGTRALGVFCRAYPLVVLEIDPPEDDISIRRQGFYERLGFACCPFAHTHPAYRARYAPHPLVVMSHPRRLTPAEYEAFAAGLRGIVMADAPTQ